MPKHTYLRHHIDLDIPFFDVDSLLIVWHGHYIKYFELARCALLERLHYDYTVMREHGFAYPIVKLEVKYVKPAQFRQPVRVECALTEYESHIDLNYTIRDRTDGHLLTRATTRQAAVRLSDGQMYTPTPDSWQQAVRADASFTPPPAP